MAMTASPKACIERFLGHGATNSTDPTVGFNGGEKRDAQNAWILGPRRVGKNTMSTNCLLLKIDENCNL
jgi:hypothetical protein